MDNLSDSINVNIVAVDDCSPAANSLRELGDECSSRRYDISPSVLPSEITEHFDTIEKLLQNKDPHTAIAILAQLSLTSETLETHGCFKDFCERLYVYFAKAYEQLKDRKRSAGYLNKAITSIEQRLSLGKLLEKDALQTSRLLADLRKRYASAKELDKDAGETSESWLKAAKAFEECGCVRDAAFSALRAVRWFITTTQPNTALQTLTWATKLTQLVDDKSDRGILNNELGIAFLAFELSEDSISCFRQALENLEDGGILIKSSILQNLGSAYIGTKKYARAIPILTEAAALYDQLGNKAGYAQTNCNLGYALACAGALKKARWHYTLAERCARETGWEAVQTQASEALAGLEQRQPPASTWSSLRPTLALCPSVAAHQARLQRKQKKVMHKRQRRCGGRRHSRSRFTKKQPTAPPPPGPTNTKQEVKSDVAANRKVPRQVLVEAGSGDEGQVEHVKKRRKHLKRNGKDPVPPPSQQEMSPASTHPPESDVDVLLASETLELPPIRPHVRQESRLVASVAATAQIDALVSAAVKRNACVTIVEPSRSVTTPVTSAPLMSSSDDKLRQRMETSIVGGYAAVAHGDQMHNCCPPCDSDDKQVSQLLDHRSRQHSSTNSHKCSCGVSPIAAACGRLDVSEGPRCVTRLPSLPQQVPSVVSANTPELITNSAASTTCGDHSRDGRSKCDAKPGRRKSRLIVPHNSFSQGSLTSPKLLLFPPRHGDGAPFTSIHEQGAKES